MENLKHTKYALYWKLLVSHKALLKKVAEEEIIILL